MKKRWRSGSLTVSAAEKKHGKIAFITTPVFREQRRDDAEAFLYDHLFQLCDHFTVLTTGRTGNFIEERIKRRPNAAQAEKIGQGMGLRKAPTAYDLGRWRETIRESLEVTMERYQGMIHVTYELVEGRLDAVIHLTDWADKSNKPDSAVLSREANVHNVPIATDPYTAVTYIRTWKKRVLDGKAPFVTRVQVKPAPLDNLDKSKHKVLAIISHDNMKSETCLFAVENAHHIFQNYDYVLATGKTGALLQRFMKAAGRSEDEVSRIRCCHSGPKGGDIQIAYAIVMGICQKIVFLQDPSVSHAHGSDILLFEQAVVAKDVHAELATNLESARLLIGL